MACAAALLLSRAVWRGFGACFSCWPCVVSGVLGWSVGWGGGILGGGGAVLVSLGWGWSAGGARLLWVWRGGLLVFRSCRGGCVSVGVSGVLSRCLGGGGGGWLWWGDRGWGVVRPLAGVVGAGARFSCGGVGGGGQLPRGVGALVGWWPGWGVGAGWGGWPGGSFVGGRSKGVRCGCGVALCGWLCSLGFQSYGVAVWSSSPCGPVPGGRWGVGGWE